MGNSNDNRNNEEKYYICIYIYHSVVISIPLYKFNISQRIYIHIEKEIEGYYIKVDTASSQEIISSGLRMNSPFLKKRDKSPSLTYS